MCVVMNVFSVTVSFWVHVTNVSKDTTLKWFKDGVETPAVYDQQTGVSTMTVQQVHIPDPVLIGLVS